MFWFSISSFYFYFSPNGYKEVTYLVKENRVNLNDNIILGSLGGSTNQRFYTIGGKTIDQGKLFSSETYLSVKIILDSEINSYSRTVYSFFDMLGFLGGIFGLVHSVAFIFVQFVSDRQYYSFVISKVYGDKWIQIPKQNKIKANENNKNLEPINWNTSMKRSRKIIPINEVSTLSKDIKEDN